MADFLTLYSLKVNPYRVEALDPLSEAKDAEMFPALAGKEQVDDVDTCLKAAVKQNKPAFVLIKGQYNCGLTSVSNYILFRYCKYRCINPSNLIVPKRATGHNNEVQLWKEWLWNLLDLLDQQVLTTPLGSFIPDCQQAISGVGPEGDFGRFISIMRRLSEALEKIETGFAFGVCLELKNVTKLDLLDKAFSMFSMTYTVLMFSIRYYKIKKNVIDFFEEYPIANKVTVHIKAIAGRRAEDVVKLRWTNIDEANPDPFEAGGLERAFEKRERPIKRIFELMRQLLELKAVDVKSTEKRWPADQELMFLAGELAAKIPILDVPRLPG